MPKGIVVQTGFDEKTGRHFGIKLGEKITPIPDDQFDIRGLKEGDPLSYTTDRESGKAIIDQPRPIIGCERARG